MSGNSDDILIATLRQTGAEIPEGATSVRELDSVALFGACACCLNAVNEARGEEQRFPGSLPSNPGVRFRACTNLAGAITALGYPEELGFNHFLYPSALPQLLSTRGVGSPRSRAVPRTHHHMRGQGFPAAPPNNSSPPRARR